MKTYEKVCANFMINVVAPHWRTLGRPPVTTTECALLCRLIHDGTISFGYAKEVVREMARSVA